MNGMGAMLMCGILLLGLGSFFTPSSKDWKNQNRPATPSRLSLAEQSPAPPVVGKGGGSPAKPADASAHDSLPTEPLNRGNNSKMHSCWPGKDHSTRLFDSLGEHREPCPIKGKVLS
jgi:hypothetical protein